MRKNRQIPIEGHPTKYLASTPQNCQGHQKQGKSGKPSQPRVLPKGTWVHLLCNKANLLTPGCSEGKYSIYLQGTKQGERVVCAQKT